MNGDGNFKMKCIDTMGDAGYTEGKIYVVNNGQWCFDDGDISGSPTIKTIADVNKWSSSKWELVEEVNTVEERMSKIAEMLGVELGEEFNIIGDGKPLNYGPYKFTERGLLDKDDCRLDKKMAELIRGIYKVEKLPQKPKDDEVVIDYEKYDYCPNCGKRLDWSEVDE